MNIHTLAVFLHILFVALFVGTGAATGILWSRGRTGEAETRLPLVEAVVAVGRMQAMVAGTAVILAGVLLTFRAGSSSGLNPLLGVKILLGLTLIGLSHFALSRAKKVAAALSEGQTNDSAERDLDMINRVAPVIAVVVIFLGIWLAHG